MSGEDPTGAAPTAGHPAILPFGRWPSPWSAADAAAGKVSRSGLLACGDSVFWSESRPGEGGRQVVVASTAGAPAVDVSPRGVSVRSRVHEYGGGAACLSGDLLFTVDQGDQRWYRSKIGALGRPVPLTPAVPPDGPVVRYADGRVTGSGNWLISVEERVTDGGSDNRLVAVAVGGSERVVALVEDGDFVSAPRVSPDGSQMAWMTWDHPDMPWDSSEIWTGRLVEADGTIGLHDRCRVAGGEGVAVGQPRWCRDGSLLFVDDRSGWWLPYRLAPVLRGVLGATGEPLVRLEAEFHAPDWVLGQSTLAELADGSLVCRMHREGRDHLVRLVPGPAGPHAPGWTVVPVEQPCVSIAGVVVTDGLAVATGALAGSERVCVLGSTPTEAQCVLEIALVGQSASRRLSAGPPSAISTEEVSVGRTFVAGTAGGPVPGLFFAPTNPRAEGPPGSRPPLVVFCHGGPTGAAEAGFDPVVQFFTSRGLAVASVDYRGSSGYGRSYRGSLDGQWGVADVEDCAGFAAALEQAGVVDGGRMAIRGTSAGGLTALGALIRSRRFAGAVAWYGVTDLEALAADTHDFESRYVDRLVGPWPEAAEQYRDRSPIHHADRVSGEVLLLQGADDPVVPPAQSARFAEQLTARKVPCRLVIFEGESHGFRQASTIEASLDAELEFYRRVFGDSGVPDASGAGA